MNTRLEVRILAYHGENTVIVVVEVQSKEILGFRRDFVCDCRKETKVDNDPGSIAEISYSDVVFQPKYLEKPITSHGDVSPQKTTHRSRQSMNLIRGPPTHPSQSDFRTTTQALHSIIADSQTTISPSQSPTSNVDPDPGAKDRNWSTNEFEVEKELELDIAHVLPHRERIWCVKFSQDGKFLATGCRNGKTYIYDVQTGNLTW